MTAPAHKASRLVVIGASAGGVSALLQLVQTLPRDFAAPICIVQHVGNNPSYLPGLLAKRGPLRAEHARDRQPLVPGVIHVAPPDHHLLVQERLLLLTRGPRENHTRPAIDPLFRSAALSWGGRAIGVILSGFLDDGTAGLAAIKERGGTAIVQDPETAEHGSMPESAIAHVAVDFTLPVPQIGPLLHRLVGAGAPADPAPAQPPAGRAPAEALVREVAINMGDARVDELEGIAVPSSLTCPDCGGALWEVESQRPLRYRCHTGHAFTARTLEHAQREAGEQALRSSVRALQEREILLRRMANITRATGDPRQASAAVAHADRLREQVRTLRGFAETIDDAPHESGNA